MDERIQYAAYGGGGVLVLALLSVPFPYPTTAVLMWTFGLSLVVAMVFSTMTYDDPETDPGGKKGFQDITKPPHADEPPVEHVTEILFGSLGATAASIVLLVFLLWL